MILILYWCGDRNAILIAIRVSGYGAEYPVKISCPECEEQFEHSFDLSKLEVKRLNAQPLRENLNLFEYITKSGIKIHFKLLTGQDELNISREQEKIKKVIKSQIDKTVTTRLFHSIISINGEEDRNKVNRMSRNLRAGDARSFRNYVDKIEPGVKMKQMVKCPHCQEESEVNIPLGISFLYPDF